MTKRSNNSKSAPDKPKRGAHKKGTPKTSGNKTHTEKLQNPPSKQTDSGFYRAFEERFRGPRDSIKERLKVYLPFVLPLLELHHSANVLDLGCGRGEWLELLRNEGFEVQGVDLDQGMLQACMERDLPVMQGEAISSLKAMDDESCSIVSGFHIVEHIPFEALQELVEEALRVLRPGGLLILETPNPENIVVGTTNFYMDPTHRHPLPPDLLAFLPEYHGFARSKILRLQEPADLASRQDLSLLDVLAGVSPDYAVVAQKKAQEKILWQLNDAFERDYGIKLHDLAQRYSHNIGGRVEGLERDLNNVRSQADEALNTLSQYTETQSKQLHEATEKVQTVQQQLTEVTARAAAEQARVEQLQPQLERAEQRIENLERELADTRSQAEEKLNTLSKRAESQSKQLQEVTEKAQSLQKKLTEMSARAEQLHKTVETEQSMVEQLTAELVEKEQVLVASQTELEQLRAHSQWLQNEWDAAKAKIEELNHSSHHWWTVADGLNQELHTVYRSKSWRITWPLRKLMQLLKWLLWLPVRFVIGFAQLPKRVARWMLTKLMAFVLRRERLKRRAMSWLHHHPKLGAHLRAFAQARGLRHGRVPIPQECAMTEVQINDKTDNTHEQTMSESNNDSELAMLTPRARQIYTDLKSAIEKHQNACN